MELLRNSRVGTKLNILIAISCIACIVLSLIGFSGLEKGKNASSNMYEDSLLPIEWIGIVESNFYHVNMNFMEIMVSKDEKRMNDLIKENVVLEISENQIHIYFLCTLTMCIIP